MIAVQKIRCKEFVNVIKKLKVPVEKVCIYSILDKYFSKNNAAARINIYGSLCSRHQDIIETTTGMFHWNQNIVWKRFLVARDEVFKKENEIL